MAGKGEIVAGCVAPHPPHLVYADNPPQNEPTSEGGWEVLRWGYESMRQSLAKRDFDVIIVHSPHWRTVSGHHFLGVPHFENKSVDPIFPNLFRYNFQLDVDVDLAEAIAAESESLGLQTKMMRNPKFRVDYGTIISCHLTHPTWDVPIVGISANRSFDYFSMDVGQRQMMALGEATRTAVEKSGKRAVLLASTSLSHRHFTQEPEMPEDMSFEHIYNHNQYRWDMHMLDLVRTGGADAMLDILPDFTQQSVSETDSGSLTWLLSALGVPDYPGHVHAYGTVIGTGNAVIEWDPKTRDAKTGSAS